MKNFRNLANGIRRLKKGKKAWLIFGLPFVVGVGLTWLNLPQTALWSGDSGFHMGTVLNTWRSGEIVGYGPPSGTLFWRYPAQFSYFFAVPHWLSGGSGLFVIGWMGVLVATLMPTLMWVSQQLWGSRWPGLAWGLLVFFTPVGIEAARSFSNPNVVLFALPWFLLSAILVEKQKRGAVWLLGAVTALLGTLHVFTFYLIFLTPLWLWWTGATRQQSLGLVLNYCLIVGLTFVPFLFVEYQNDWFAAHGFWFDVSRVSGAEISRLEMLTQRLTQFFELYLRLFGSTVTASIAVLLSIAGMARLIKPSGWNADLSKTRWLIIVGIGLGVGQFFVFSGLIWPWYFTIHWVWVPLLVVLGMLQLRETAAQFLPSGKLPLYGIPLLAGLVFVLPNAAALQETVFPSKPLSPADYYASAQEVAHLVSTDAGSQPFRFYYQEMPNHQGSFEYFWAKNQDNYSCTEGDIYLLVHKDSTGQLPERCLKTALPLDSTNYALYRALQTDCPTESIAPHFDFRDIRSCSLEIGVD